MARASRFGSLRHGACVYVAELSNGLVKVGYSQNPRTRLGSLSAQARRRFRADVTRWHVGPAFNREGDGRYAEALTLARMSRIATPVNGAAEFFHGARFEIARQLCEQLSRPLAALR
jgi:hypothetical protein